ncbi:hypothetical protein PCASD_24345 [Puccinia coronata f. sp. avenae]|uniref:Uncharacterized protein n=1 Tax=Puccinia coronata f. sp. avenae TaxID=200324 RepID=A0A2N5RYW2_9BASI|nr:hypothetical protein PCASD_24345 [Puccinia coronata f. sp. avenae]
MKWLACLFLSSSSIVVAELANYESTLHSDGQLSDLSNQLASPTCSNNHHVGFDSDVNESVDTRGKIMPAVPSNASPDEEALKEIHLFLVDFSESPDVEEVFKKRHHIESRVTIPPSRWQTQSGGNILGKGKKAKFHNDEPGNKEMLESIPGVSKADLSNPTSSNHFSRFRRKFASTLTEKSTQLENRLDANEIGKRDQLALQLEVILFLQKTNQKGNRQVELST